MDRETEAAPQEAQATNGLPAIFQRPTYPSGELATRAPERVEEPPSKPADAPRERSRSTTSAERVDRTATPESSDDAEGPSGSTSSGTRRHRRGGRGRGGRGRGGDGGSGGEASSSSDGASGTDVVTIERSEPET